MVSIRRVRNNAIEPIHKWIAPAKSWLRCQCGASVMGRRATHTPPPVQSSLMEIGYSHRTRTDKRQATKPGWCNRLDNISYSTDNERHW